MDRWEALKKMGNFEFQPQQAIIYEHQPEMGLLFDSISQSIILTFLKESLTAVS
jgi:hypothetical protein